MMNFTSASSAESQDLDLRHGRPRPSGPPARRPRVRRAFAKRDGYHKSAAFPACDDLAYSTDPDRAVQHADALHLEHQFILRQSGVLGLQPVQSFRCTDFLNIEKFE